MMTRVVSVSLVFIAAFAALAGLFLAGGGGNESELIRSACLLILGCFLVLLAIYLEIIAIIASLLVWFQEIRNRRED